MLYLNKVALMGNLTRDLEVRHTQTGTPVGNTSVAVNESWKDGDEWKEKTTFIDLVFWGKIIEYIQERFKKGAHVYVEGSIQNRDWEDKEGVKRRSTEVKVSVAKLSQPPRGASSEVDAPSTQAREPVSAGSKKDDIPF